MNTQKIQRCCLPLCLMLSMLLCLCTAALAEGAASQPQSALSPTTGLPSDRPYRPFLVIVSNAYQARPPWGLSEADIVYEMIIHGPAHTRYAAIFNDSHPERVGAIRSARYYHTYLCQEWDCPFSFYGGKGFQMENTRMDRMDARFGVSASLLFNGIISGPYSRGYSRDSSRVSPHNAIADLARWAAECWPADAADETLPHEPSLPLFQFFDPPTQGREVAAEIEIHFEGTDKKEPNYLAGYAYNPELHAYERSYCGYAQKDAESGKRIVAHNVIIQFCQTTYRNEMLSEPMIEITGEGPIDAYIDGKRIEGTWQRESVDDKTQFYDAEGEVLLLRPGKTFIQVIPTTYGFAYDATSALCRYAPDLPVSVGAAANP